MIKIKNLERRESLRGFKLIQIRNLMKRTKIKILKKRRSKVRRVHQNVHKVQNSLKCKDALAFGNKLTSQSKIKTKMNLWNKSKLSYKELISRKTKEINNTKKEISNSRLNSSMKL